MAEFDPTPPPLDLPAAPDVLSPNIPLNPPMVGEASPFIHVDGQNRDIILDSIRTWIRVSLLPWTTNWQTQLTDWETDAADQLNAWMVLADEYISSHAVAGLSFRTTTTDIAGTGSTNCVFVVDTDLRPLTVGDLALDQSPDGNYGIITAVIDSTHATVLVLGTLHGPQGYGFRTTATPIAGAGDTTVVLAADTARPFLIGDLVLDTDSDSNVGIITALVDATHATVTYVTTLKGQKGDPGDPGEPGDPGTPGANGRVVSVVAGSGIDVDSTDPSAPVVSALGVGTIQYTDLVAMDADMAANLYADGTKATLVTSGIIGSLWTASGHVWTAPDLIFPTDLKSDWYAWTSIITGGTYTHISMVGAQASEGVNGTRPAWVESLVQFVEDPDNHNRQLASGTNSNGVITRLSNNLLKVVGATVIDLQEFMPRIIGGGVPPYTNDIVDAVEIRMWGQVSDNGTVSLTWQRGEVEDTDSTHYMGAGNPTINYTAGSFTLDTAWVQPFGFQGKWNLADDTTDFPTFLDVVLRVRNISEVNIPIWAEIVSEYFTNPNGGAQVNRWFHKTGTYYFYSPDSTDFIDGAQINCAHAFTGFISVRAI